MISMDVRLIEVNYDAMVERYLPEAFKNVTDESKLSMKIANELLVKNKFTSTIVKGIVKSVPQRRKEKLALDILKNNEEKIIIMLNTWMKDNNVDLHIADLSGNDCDQEGRDGIKVEINLEEIEYSSLATGLLPKILQSLSEKDDKQGDLGRILVDMKEAPAQMITAALEVLPQEKKDELVAKIFGVYKADIVDLFNQKIKEQQIAAVISNIDVNVTK